MNGVEDLDVFKMAHELALKTYATTKKFPREETFSLEDDAFVITAFFTDDVKGREQIWPRK